MKKWFACLAVAGLLFSAGVGVSHAESWYALDTDQNGRTDYIDNDTVDKNDARYIALEDCRSKWRSLHLHNDIQSR